MSARFRGVCFTCPSAAAILCGMRGSLANLVGSVSGAGQISDLGASAARRHPWARDIAVGVAIAVLLTLPIIPV